VTLLPSIPRESGFPFLVRALAVFGLALGVTAPSALATETIPLNLPPSSAKGLDTTTLRVMPQLPLPKPERLLFDLVWGGWSFRWVHAGQATLEILPTASDQILEMRSLAWCTDFFQTFYPVRDTVSSWIHARGLYPLRFSKILNEGGYHYRGQADFDQVKHVMKSPDTTLAIAPFAHDILSAFYFIRTQPLKVGDSFDLAAVSGKKAYKLRVLCHRKETVTVPAGTFQALVVEPILKDDGLFKAKGTLLIWLTDDKRHMPVKMQSKIPVGSIKAELVSHLPAHDDASK